MHEITQYLPIHYYVRLVWKLAWEGATKELQQQFWVNMHIKINNLNVSEDI